jgi:hypothetical protein
LDSYDEPVEFPDVASGPLINCGEKSLNFAINEAKG